MVYRWCEEQPGREDKVKPDLGEDIDIRPIGPDEHYRACSRTASSTP